MRSFIKDRTTGVPLYCSECASLVVVCPLLGPCVCVTVTLRGGSGACSY